MIVFPAAALLALATGCPGGGNSGPDGGKKDAGGGADSGGGNDSGVGDSGSGADGGDGGNTPGLLSGTWTLHDLGDLANVDVPAPIPSPPQVYVPDPYGFPGRTFYGSSTGDGVFSVSGVPAGPVYLCMGLTPCYATPSRSVDLSSYQYGRPNVGTPNGSSQMSFALSGLDPWLSTDVLQVTSAGVNGAGVIPATLGAGATSLAQTFSMSQLPINALIDASKGDAVAIYQLHSLTDAGAGLQGSFAGPAAVFTQVTVADGQLTPVSGALAHGTPLSIGGPFKADAFGALDSAVGANAVGGTNYVEVWASPVALSSLSGLGTMFSLYGSLGPGDQPLPYTFSNPFPPSWTAIAYASHSVQVTVSNLPVAGGGTAQPVQLDTTLGVTDTLAAFQAGPVQPVVGPPGNLMVNSSFAFSTPVTGTGLRPRISWDAPALGTANYYVVNVTVFSVDGNGLATVASTAQVTTTALYARVADGVITPGASYIVDVTAVAAPNDLPETQPNVNRLPRATARVFSSGLLP